MSAKVHFGSPLVISVPFWHPFNCFGTLLAPFLLRFVAFITFQKMVSSAILSTLGICPVNCFDKHYQEHTGAELFQSIRSTNIPRNMYNTGARICQVGGIGRQAFTILPSFCYRFSSLYFHGIAWILGWITRLMFFNSHTDRDTLNSYAGLAVSRPSINSLKKDCPFDVLAI